MPLFLCLLYSGLRSWFAIFCDFTKGKLSLLIFYLKVFPVADLLWSEYYYNIFLLRVLVFLLHIFLI